MTSTQTSSEAGVVDRVLIETLRALPAIPTFARDMPGPLLARAELHGLAGVVHDGLFAAGVELDCVSDTTAARRETAREMDHAAHLALLMRIDQAFHAAGLVAVALKGPLLAERFYPRPAARATSDVDLLVAESNLERAVDALASVGYVAATGPRAVRFRREHHHLELSHPAALPLELHFHAYRGFGRVLRSETLLSRRHPALAFRSIGVLAPADELVFLGVHAAAHRFIRLGWLFDLRLLVATMTTGQIEVAAHRAREWGYARPLAFTASLLVELLGVDPNVLAPLGRLGSTRQWLLSRIVAEPRSSIFRAATRFAYTAALCDSFTATASYTRFVLAQRTRFALRRE